MELGYCKYCDRTLPLTEEFWYWCGKEKIELDTWKCKACKKEYSHRRYLAAKEHGEALVRESEDRIGFDPVGKAAMKDQVRRAFEPIPSIYKDILK